MATATSAAQHQFPCSQCGATLEFAPGKSALVCPYCGGNAQIPTSSAVIEELEYSLYVNGIPDGEHVDETLAVECSGCGARTQLGKNVTSDKCVFCGAAVVVAGQSKRLIKPRALLPFAIDRTKAQADFHNWLASLWFAPNNLLKMAESGRLTGVYVPFWTFDADVQTVYTGERGVDHRVPKLVTEYVNGKEVERVRMETETIWNPVSGIVQNRFDDLLVMATNSLPPKHAEHLEPWDLPKLVPYTDEYLAGFAAESYRVDLPDGFASAQKKAEPTIRQTICSDIGGDHQEIKTLQSEYTNITFKHILLPMWISAYHYGGHPYRFLINARTGGVRGERPYSAAKITLFILAILAVIITITIVARLHG